MENLTFLATLASLFVTLGAIHLPNQHCEPRPTLVALGHPHYNFFPFFVILHRCGGSCGTLSPAVKECVPTVYTDVPISHFPININNGGIRIVREKNHTSCGCRCVRKANECTSQYEEWNENNCFCKCLYNNSDPPTPCPIGYSWNRNACRCECINAPHVCGASQNWSKVDCKCVTVQTAPRSGRSRKRNLKSEKKGVSSTLFVVFIVVEFAVLCIVFDAILYHRQAGIFYRIQLKLRKQGPTFETVMKDDICREINLGDPNMMSVQISGKETAI